MKDGMGVYYDRLFFDRFLSITDLKAPLAVESYKIKFRRDILDELIERSMCESHTKSEGEVNGQS